MRDKPTVYYDGVCPVCSREIAHYRTRRGADGLAWVDAARCEPGALGADLTREAALARMHVRLPDGRLVSGAAAFAVLWQGLPGFRWLGRLVAAPGVRHVAEGAYLLFQRSRGLGRFGRRRAAAAE
jgi:predicted DCC family thiol-disulfide oxidoreductase YuxK